MTPYQKHLTYMRGWADGAGKHSMSEAYVEGYIAEPRKLYEAGYVEGQIAWRWASTADATARGVRLSDVKAQA